MASFGDAIKYLYGKFLLRDILSFVTPGAIVVLTATYLFFPEMLCRSIAWPLYIPLFGLFYATGFAVECLERLFGCVRLHTLDNASCKQRWSILCGNWRKKPDIYKEFREAAIQFLWMSRHHDWAGQDYERKIVLKQMCANNFGAIIIAGVLFLFSFCQNVWVKFGILSLVILFLLLSLYWGYRDFTIAVTTTEDKFKSLREGK